MEESEEEKVLSIFFEPSEVNVNLHPNAFFDFHILPQYFLILCCASM